MKGKKFPLPKVLRRSKTSRASFDQRLAHYSLKFTIEKYFLSSRILMGAAIGEKGVEDFLIEFESLWTDSHVAPERAAEKHHQKKV